MLYGDRSGPGCTAARYRFKPVTFPHSRRARLMRHMCSACPAVLFYSKSYQRMKEWPAQRGVSWHQRLLQEGKSQKVEASHMCCAGDEKLRCNTAVLFYFFFPPLFQQSLCIYLKKKKTHSLLKFMMTLYNFVTLSDFSKGSVALMDSWRAHAVDGKNSLNANKMAARKVPVVQCAMHAAAKQEGNDCRKQRRSPCFGLESFTDKPLSPETRKKKKSWPVVTAFVFVIICMCYCMNWEMHGRMACSNEFLIPCVLVSAAWMFRKAFPWVIITLKSVLFCEIKWILILELIRVWLWGVAAFVILSLQCFSAFFIFSSPWPTGSPYPPSPFFPSFIFILEAPSCTLHGIIFGRDVPYAAAHQVSHQLGSSVSAVGGRSPHGSSKQPNRGGEKKKWKEELKRA